MQKIFLGVLILVVALLFIIPIQRIPLKISIDYNEGWNVYHAQEAIQGKALYKQDLRVLNYPPISFYVIGFIGRITENYLITGRIISLISLIFISIEVGYIVYLLKGTFVQYAFTALFSCGLFLTLAMGYIGMNDPQLLAHVFILAGCIIYLRDRKSSVNLFFTALFFSIGLFTKHNLLPLPIAVTIDIYFYSMYSGRKNHRYFFYWLIYMTFISGGFFLITQFLSHGDFIHAILLKRQYGWGFFTRAAFPLLGFLIIPFICVSPFLWRIAKTQQYRIILFYFAASVLFDLYTAGGSGTGVNIFFDSMISLSLLIGVILISLWSTLSKKDKNLSIGMFYLLSLYIVILTPLRFSITKSYAEMKQQESTMEENVLYIRQYSGSVLCESKLLCYFANKPFDYDPFLVNEMILTRSISEKTILQKVEEHYFSVIELKTLLSSEYTHGSSYGALQRGQANYTKNFYRAVGNYYQLARKTPDAYFYTPKSSY